MALMIEEAVLLVKKGICELIELPGLNNSLSEEQRQEIKEVDQKYVKYNMCFIETSFFIVFFLIIIFFKCSTNNSAFK